jgi:dienelactone hydrolase
MRASPWIATAAAAVVLVAVPGGAAGDTAPDPVYPVAQFADLFAGAAQAAAVPGAERTRPFGANPAFMPDWDHNGVFGDAGDYAIENSTGPGRAPFRYPCIALSGEVTYRTTSGACVAGDRGAPFLTGEATKLRVVDQFGYELAATLFVPGEARAASGRRLPGVVIADGAQASMQTFYMYAMTLAEEGIVVLSFDFAGQGQSEDGGQGFFHDFQGSGVGGDCHPTRPCMETEDMVRWFTGAAVVRNVDGPQSPTRGGHDPAQNPRNPALGVLDTTRIGLVGQSMGGLTVSNYLWYLPTGHGADGRPLPAVRAAVGLSGFAPASAAVPYQLQTADLDIPGRDAHNGWIDSTDGPAGTKAYYDELRHAGRGDGALELVVIESGSHGDTSNATRLNGLPVPRTTWASSVSTMYAAAWMGCHLSSRGDACAQAVAPLPHLSRAQASEYDADGPAGPAPSRCITVPDKATLEQAYDPVTFAAAVLGHPAYDCVP